MGENKLNILNKFFTRDMLRCFVEGHSNKTYSSVVKKYVDDYQLQNNAALLKAIYSELKLNYRNEYFYKNTLLNKLLLGVHSINTTTALTELPVGKSKADFVLINGKAIVYEIKTELDNFERLKTQVDDYYKAFDHVAVVTCEKNVKQIQKKVQQIEKPVGIYCLKKDGALSEVRKTEKYREELEAESIFKILRKREYEDIIKRQYGTLPETTSFKQYAACKELFIQIPLEESYKLFLKALKSRVKIEKEEFLKIPYELKFLAYFSDLKVNDYQKIKVYLEETYGGV